MEVEAEQAWTLLARRLTMPSEIQCSQQSRPRALLVQGPVEARPRMPSEVAVQEGPGQSSEWP